MTKEKIIDDNEWLVLVNLAIKQDFTKVRLQVDKFIQKTKQQTANKIIDFIKQTPNFKKSDLIYWIEKNILGLKAIKFKAKRG